METENLEEIINKYAKIVVKESKENLVSKGRGGALSESISYQLETEANAFLLDFLMEDYGPYLDEGVQGSNPSGIYKNNPNKTGVQKAPLSQFKYTTKMPPAKVFDKWSIKKGIAPRNARGQFLPRKSINFSIARSIFFQGIYPTYFFSKPFNSNLDMLDKGILEAFALDIEKAIILGTK
jgi:hypothetical protein|tara:strand:+ start:1795 stop:2334 length:540 start_codon:yes stop_codon:yes gene_type:complete